MEKVGNKVLATVLISTAVLGTLTFSPLTELQAKDSVDSQTKASTEKPSIGAQAAAAKQQGAKATAVSTVTASTSKAIEAQLAAKGVKLTKLTAAQQKNTYVDVIIQLAAAPAAENGSLDKATASTGEIEAATQQVVAAQASVKRQVEAITNQAATASYGYVVNGFATKVKIQDLSKVAQLPGVKSVTLAKVYYKSETSANDMANVSTVWSSYKYKGQGTVVSIIDTGIDPNHKDMRLSKDTKVKLTEDDVTDFTKQAGYGKYFTDKVPYGHNYADNNETITDDDPEEQHGMHVSGIVAANGTGSDPTTSVQGVAPEAQLLAMKAFSNSDSSATTDSTSVIGAIDDSAKLGADVLNMSLGSTSGEQTTDDPEIAAIENAVDAGTAAVISAGNAGTTGSDQAGVNTDFYGNPDLETVGAPGTARSATTVASAENTKTINTAITIAAPDGTNILGPEITQTAAGIDLAAFNGKQFVVVDDGTGQPGIGTPDQFANVDVKGKIAIVKRGETNFTEKQANAKAAGAAGVIIINNAGGDTPLTSASYDAGFPTAGLSTNSGAKLVAYLAQNPDAALNVTIGLKQMDNAAAATDKMSTFTSYGPVSDLSFKPDITAPGGNIWSTQNNNGYTNLSGTSMASPFIAGTQALLSQAMNDQTNPFYKYYQSLSGSDKVDLMKAIEMNTAAPVTDVDHDGVIESPRREGAGAVNAAAAIDALTKNPSTVTFSNGYPAIELKDFAAATRQFTLKFTNRTDKAITYTQKDGGKLTDVYTSATDPTSGILYDKKIDGAAIKADTAIEVPANSTKEVTFTMTLPSDFAAQQYVEGFLSFTGSDQSTLGIPYMGFFGDWSKPQLFDTLNGPTFTPATTGNFGTSVNIGNPYEGLRYTAGLEQDDQGNYVIDPDEIAMSTDPNAQYNELQPQYYLFRNANNVTAQILDDKGQVLSTLGSFATVTKTYWEATASAYYTFDYAPTWDGTIVDQSTGKATPVKDGTYTYRVTGTIDGTDKTQSYDIKVKVDSKKPELRNLGLTKKTNKDGSESYFMTAEAKDDFSGLSKGVNTAINGIQDSENYIADGTTADGFTKLLVPLSDEQAKTLAAGHNAVSAAVFDNASNAITDSAEVNKPGETNFGLVLLDDAFPDTISSTTPDVSADANGKPQFEFTGTYPAKPVFTYTNAKGEEVDGQLQYSTGDDSFGGALPLEDGDYSTTVRIYTDATKSTVAYEKQINVRMAAPTINTVAVDGTQTFDGKTDKTAKEAGTSEDSVKVTGTVSADTKSLQITSDTAAAPVDATIAADGSFSADVPVTAGTNNLTLTATDEDGNTSTVDQAVDSSNQGQINPSAADVTFANGIKFGTNYVNLASKGYDPKTGDFTLTGKVKRATTTLTIGDQVVHPDSDNNFTITLHVGNAESAVFPILIGDSTQDKIVQERLSFYVDGVGPTLTIDQAKDTDGDGENDVINTSDPQFTISGTMTDNYSYYDLYINGSNVGTAPVDSDMNNPKPLNKKFSFTENLKPGKNVFDVEMLDLQNNYAEEVITVNYTPQGTTTTTGTPAGTTDTTKADAAAIKAAKAALKAKLTQARTLGASGKYTHETAAVLAAARKQAQLVLNDKTATLKQVQDATDALQKAIDGLVEKPAKTTTGDPAAAKQAVLDDIAAAKAQLTASGLDGDKYETRTFVDAIAALAKDTEAGTITPEQAKTQLNQLLDAALDTLTESIKDATPAAIGNADDAATGRTFYGDLDNAHNLGKAATDPDAKVDELAELSNVSAAIKAAAKPQDTTSDPQVKTASAEAASTTKEAYYDNTQKGEETTSDPQVKTQSAAPVAVAKDDFYDNTQKGQAPTTDPQVKTQSADPVSVAQDAFYDNTKPAQFKDATGDAVSVAADAFYDNTKADDAGQSDQDDADTDTGAQQTPDQGATADTKADGKQTADKAKDAKDKALPKTGNVQPAGIVALGAAMITGLLTLMGLRRKQD
ncbi:S8 family serine peptidase [Lacticaseibacillus jixianensis]|uniref:S8 family serine peptidase n=1 Tax=Lacticaseibacillus jixianensis TaxID=2486012 RepID=A0ABW4B9A6_9LACO|nr:S8 family serine peptidase [Lacticaseibacillus jixianensis]